MRLLVTGLVVLLTACGSGLGPVGLSDAGAEAPDAATVALGGSAGAWQVGGSAGLAGASGSGGSPVGTGGAETQPDGGGLGGDPATVGSSTGGYQVGGSTTGGTPAAGGASSGGSVTGGNATGGSSTGGLAAGGAATGGVSTGGTATGGHGTGGAPSSPDCWAIPREEGYWTTWLASATEPLPGIQYSQAECAMVCCDAGGHWIVYQTAGGGEPSGVLPACPSW